MIELDSAQREARAREVRHEVVAQLTVGTHRTFRILFAVQWAVAVAAGVEFRAARRLARPVHVDPRRHVVRAGDAVRARRAAAPGGCGTAWRSCQIGWSMLFMWLLEGRSEAQFHVFVSLAFLAFYRDWRVLLTATLAAIALSDRAHRAAARLVRHRRIGLVARLRPGASGWWPRPRCCCSPCAQSLKTVCNFATHAADLQLDQRDASAQTSSERTRRARAQPRAVPADRRDHARHSVRARSRARPLHLHRAAGARQMLGIPEARWKESGFLDELLPREREAERAPPARRMHARHVRDPVLGGHRPTIAWSSCAGRCPASS